MAKIEFVNFETRLMRRAQMLDANGKWRELAKAVKRRDGNKCQNRGQFVWLHNDKIVPIPKCKDPSNPDLERDAHHLYYPAINIPVWDTPLKWLITLCRHCHSAIHGNPEDLVAQETFTFLDKMQSKVELLESRMDEIERRVGP